MPSWVTTRLYFSSEEKANIVYLAMFWHGKRFSFKSLMPHPQTREECETSFLMTQGAFCTPTKNKPWLNWYNWNIAKWGCKWDCRDASVCGNFIEFLTPWDPPHGNFLQLIADKFRFSFTRKSWDEGEDQNEKSSKFPDKKYTPGRIKD